MKFAMSSTWLNQVSFMNMSDLSWLNLIQNYPHEIDCNKLFTQVMKSTCSYYESALGKLNYAYIYKKLNYMQHVF